MARKDTSSYGAMFWIMAVILAVGVLLGVFYWMLQQPGEKHSPNRPSGLLWNAPALTRSTAKTC